MFSSDSDLRTLFKEYLDELTNFGADFEATTAEFGVLFLESIEIWAISSEHEVLVDEGSQQTFTIEYFVLLIYFGEIFGVSCFPENLLEIMPEKYTGKSGLKGTGAGLNEIFESPEVTSFHPTGLQEDIDGKVIDCFCKSVLWSLPPFSGRELLDLFNLYLDADIKLSVVFRSFVFVFSKLQDGTILSDSAGVIFGFFTS